MQASFQQRCERSGKLLRAVLTTGRLFAITPTGPSTERWDLNEMCKLIATRYLIMMEIKITQRK